ncbi:androgen-induced gene 1 protein isoform X4 [Sphaerodactylus townsendi]|uniref:androgen-induced gene 1 protein isoform X4 n=1 Tax=Sphaerodactylus townsendi TaxID=933632 RepID=UPI00202715AC|nr:androgen-induced gene 1 protein isoform X4 [Sphaerodactylus townsendi]
MPTLYRTAPLLLEGCHLVLSHRCCSRGATLGSSPSLVIRDLRIRTKFVVTMFWSIYIYDRELVYPKLLDNFIPPWLNHGMHTTVLPFILIEMRTTHHEYPSRTSGLIAVCTFSVAYILWVCWIYHVTGVWVYPLLEYLGSGTKIIFFAIVTAIITIFYLLGEILNNCIWDTQKCMEEGKEKPKLD